MSSLDLDAIKKRLQGLPEGPWYARGTDDQAYMNARFVSTEPGPRGPSLHHDGDNNMDFRNAVIDHEKVLAITLLQSPPLATNDAFDELTIFFAAARADIPALIAEVERLNQVVRTYYDALVERETELDVERFNHQQWLSLHEENIKLRWEELMEFQRWQAEKEQSQ